MAVAAYQGHEDYSTAKVRNTNPENVAPAERQNYDPDSYSAEPGAAARGNGYPRIG